MKKIIPLGVLAGLCLFIQMHCRAFLPNIPCVCTRALAAGGTPVAAAAGCAQDSTKRDTLRLDEVEINMGYYTVKDRERTGSVARVTAKDIGKQPVLNLMEAMKGRMAGVDIQQHSGDPGGGFTIRIRGENSLRADANEPLYLVDGIPFPSTSLHQSLNFNRGGSNPLNTLNPNDIESVEVLKDADATAIYGSRGSNGVVLITTKKGARQGSDLSVNLAQGFSRVPRTMAVLSSRQYLDMRNEAFANSGLAKNTGNAYDLLTWDTTRSTDWQRELLGETAASHSLQASYTGHYERMNYLLSASHQGQGNVYPGDFRFRRTSAMLNLSQGSPSDQLRLDVALNYAFDRNDLPVVNNTNAALTLPPIAPAPFDENGDLVWLSATYNNPFAYLQTAHEATSRTAGVTAALSYRLSQHLEAKVSGGYRHYGVDERNLYPASANDPSFGFLSRVDLAAQTLRSWLIEPQLTWEHALGSGMLRVLLGGSIQRQGTERQALEASEFTDEAFMDNIQLAGVIRALGYGHTDYRYLAAFARVNYTYAGRYVLNATARRDGSSRFGPGKQWGNFGAIGAAWLFADEPMIRQAVPWLSTGKLRASYGVTGSDQIGDYGYLTTYEGINTNYTFLGLNLYPTRLANPDFHWETNRKLETALDLGFFADRLRLSLSWYRNRSGNQLVGYPLAAINGFRSVQYNLPATVENRGFEALLDAQLLVHSPVRWSLSVNMTAPTNALLDYPGIAHSAHSSVYRIGSPLDIRRRNRYQGIDPETGWFTFADLDGSGTVTSADRDWFVPARVYYGGLANTLAYRGFECDVYLQFDQRTRIMRPTFALPGAPSNQPVGVLDRWQRAGDDATIQRFWPSYSGAASTAYNLYTTSDAVLKLQRFVRLSNVSLAWQLPNGAIRPLGIKRASIGVACQNLAVFGRFDLLDPESDYNQLPPLRSLRFSLHANF